MEEKKDKVKISEEDIKQLESMWEHAEEVASQGNE